MRFRLLPYETISSLIAIYMYTMSLLRNRDFHELSDEEKQQVIETRSLMFGAVTGKPASVCPNCGASFAGEDQSRAAHSNKQEMHCHKEGQ